jgi:ubiquinone biosynthesis protein COQ9
MRRYSKRALLGGVYMASELYMLTDYSPNFEDTISFMDRQLREVQSKGAMAGLMFQQAEALLQQALQSMKDGRPK